MSMTGTAARPRDAAMSRVRRMADLLDSRFRVPGTPIRFGFDAVIGLLPVAGDTLTLILAGWILVEAHRAGVRRRALVRMAGNIAIDWLVGLVPLLGDLFDIGWKANRRNAAIMADELARQGGG